MNLKTVNRIVSAAARLALHAIGRAAAVLHSPLSSSAYSISEHYGAETSANAHFRLASFSSSHSAAWYLRLISARSTEGFGNDMPSSSMLSATICETAKLRNHLWLAGITYHGALRVLVSVMASSNASI